MATAGNGGSSGTNGGNGANGGASAVPGGSTGGTDNAIMEEIIRRRLQNDGDGMGDDRKLNSLVKSYLSLVDGEELDEESDAAALKRFIQQIRHMEYVAKRTVAAIKVNEEAKEAYVKMKAEVVSEINDTQAHIDKSKKLLDEATKHRKYSMEYDALAKLIESKEDRKMTELKRMGLDLELDVLTKREKKIADKLDFRRRTVGLLSGSIELVKELVKTSEEKAPRPRKPKKKKRSKHLNTATAGTSTAMDVDSTSQSEPPSPLEPTPPQEVPNGAMENAAGTASSSITNLATPVPPAASTVANNAPSASTTSSAISPSQTQPGAASMQQADKSKSEKYEDLSESEGDEHS